MLLGITQSSARRIATRAPLRLHLRAFASATASTPAEEELVQLTAPAAYVSTSTDPWFNLSYEDWLLRNTPVSQPLLFIYRNAQCVVIGRNQNPWKETTPRQLLADGIPLVRRRSGGGTVYHDMGNTNFSIMLPRLTFTRSGGANLVAKAIRERLDVPSCTVNSRNDVIVREGDKDLKVSGSAYKIIQHRAYHHGTMLISSDVSTLGRALHSDSPHLETKGIASFRSAVSTLNLHRRRQAMITHDDFVAALKDEFRATYPGHMEEHVVNEGEVDLPKVWDGVKDLASWEWQYGQTPEFTNKIEGELSFGRVTATLASRHALLTQFSLELAAADEDTQDALNAISTALVGKRYEALSGAEADLAADVPAQLAAEVLAWLRTAM